MTTITITTPTGLQEELTIVKQTLKLKNVTEFEVKRVNGKRSYFLTIHPNNQVRTTLYPNHVTTL